MARFIPRTLSSMSMRFLSSSKNQICQAARQNSSLTSLKVSPAVLSTSSLMKFNKMHSVSCGCGRCGYHTQGDKQMVAFLSEEISMEKQAVKSTDLPSMSGYEVSRNEAEVVLTKKMDGETLRVRFNVNHTIESEELQSGEEEQTQMVSKPPFSVEITKNGQETLTIQCSFPPPEDMDDPTLQEGDVVDEFDIEEIALHGGEWSDTTYAVSAGTMDGNLYDLLMTMLEDRGIDNKFANDLVNYSTTYEQKVYIGFLEKLQKFVDQQ